MPKKETSAPAKTLNKPAAPPLDDDGLPDLPDEDFAQVEKELETKAATGKKKKKELTETPLSGMPDLGGPDVDDAMEDPQPSGGMARSLSEIADRLSDSNNSLANRMESLQSSVKSIFDLVQVRFDELQGELKALKDSFHPILKDALAAGGGTGKLADVAHEQPKGTDAPTVGKLAKACGQSTARAQELLNACYKFKNAVPYPKVVAWLVDKCGLTEKQANGFLNYLGLSSDEYESLDAADFPKL